MTADPIYCFNLPSEYAAARKQQALDLGCSEEYAERLRKDVEARAVMVKSSFEANSIQRLAAAAKAGA